MNKPGLFLAAALAAAIWDEAEAQQFPLPQTPMHAVTNVYFGTNVVDNYQWLENFDDPAVKQWNAAENRASRALLDALPGRAAIADRLTRLYSGASANYSSLVYRPGVIFALKAKPPAQQPWLVRLASADDPASEWTVVDPNKIDPRGATTIDWWAPSLDGRLMACSLSENGSEDGTIFIFDVATGQPLADRIPRAQYPTAGGSAAWNADGSGLFYTHYPAPGERGATDTHFFQQIYFHHLGAPAEPDRYELGREFPRIAEITLETRKDGRYTLATVANGDGGEYEHFLRGTDGHWTQLTHFADGVRGIAFGEDEALYMVTRLNAPRGKVLRVPLDNLAALTPQIIVPESSAVIEGLCPLHDAVYAQLLEGGPSGITLFNSNAEAALSVPTKAVSSIQQMLLLPHDQLLFRNTTFIDPYIWMLFDPLTGKSRATALAGTSPADFSDVEVRREFAVSHDGTKIPLNIICHKGVLLDSNNPTLLYGYGGYGINLSPSFSASRSLWLEQNGVYVIANLRGGGEYGEEWHKAGNLTHKQNVFDDFAACAQYLVDRGYTQPARLAVEGRSNGGLLMGAFLTQHPQMARAVVSGVGIYDSLRSELEPNGAFNVTEFGTVRDLSQFRALYAYSPYHQVVDGTSYPAVLLTTGDHDGRVNPYHSRKMAARLQAANRSTHPILLRTTAAAGHGMGTALKERIAEEADEYAFLFNQLGVNYKP
ncbi:MAG TPA: prolyl oligopeptidase family serine peptidase [Verrucomicrobiae bacterium]|jgi:prolyl oligopeptidase|nr:prolyl oligopeptidase family serine peptidase [Verrucomicrobiae bacterium]